MTVKLHKIVPITSEKNLKGKRVLVRADFNVSLSDKKEVMDDFRIKQAIPTIKYLMEQGAKVILISHFQSSISTSLEPVSFTLRNYIPHTFVPNMFSQEAQQIINDMKEGEVVLLENLRLNAGEEKNDPTFVQQLASYADVYVNEAFSVSHRSHASVAGLPTQLPAYAGIQLMQEVSMLSKAFKPMKPFVFCIGGAKFSTKLPLIQRFLNTADTIIVMGALANDIYKARGYEVGQSVVSDDLDAVRGFANDTRITVPMKVVVNGPQGTRECDVTEVKPDEKIYDAAKSSLEEYAEKLSTAQLIVWNGPSGLYEGGYVEGTQKLAEMIAKNNGMSLVGGGDTLSAIKALNLGDSFDFVSTGGGAMLDFLASDGDIPGIRTLIHNRPSFLRKLFF